MLFASTHLTVRFLLPSFASLSLQCVLDRWSRRWLPVRSLRTRRTTTRRVSPNCLSAQDSVSFRHLFLLQQTVLYKMRWFNRMSPHVQMVRTLIPRCCRLWAARRWRWVEQSHDERSVWKRVCEFLLHHHHPFCSQYAVPVTKYDRKGYKARPRQLLLTSNSAVIVEEAKLKQRIDYGALKGQRSTARWSI